MQNNKKCKILMVLGTLNYGGAEIFCLNFVKNINREKYQIDFAVTNLTCSNLEKEICNLGCKIHLVPKFNGLNVFNYRRAWKKLLSENHYDIVHGHASGPMALYLKEANKKGCATIAHSHSASTRGNVLKKAVKKIWAINAKKYADYWFACSHLAALRLFGKNYNKHEKYRFIPNGIDVEKFKFSSKSRIRIRNKLGISDATFVVGHVGSFTKPKNHRFIFDVFKAIIDKQPKSCLVLCGDGPLRKKYEMLANKRGLDEFVYFLGNVDNTNDFYSAFDTFIFPSFFEGLPVSLIEAQTSGLNIICSKKISNEICLTNHIVQLSIKNKPSVWAEKLFQMLNDNSNRLDDFEIMNDSKYTISHTVAIVTNVYDEIISKSR